MSEPKPEDHITADEYKVGLFEMTGTMASWLSGFPVRPQQVQDELGMRFDVREALKQYEVVKTAQANCAANNGKTIRNAVIAAEKLNAMLVSLEYQIRDRNGVAYSVISFPSS